MREALLGDSWGQNLCPTYCMKDTATSYIAHVNEIVCVQLHLWIALIESGIVEINVPKQLLQRWHL
jgi:hypothetical protein